MNHFYNPICLLFSVVCLLTSHESRATGDEYMQNKPNFKKARTNATYFMTKDYDNWTLGERVKNEPKTNPNEPKCKKAKMNASTVLTKNYNGK